MKKFLSIISLVMLLACQKPNDQPNNQNSNSTQPVSTVPSENKTTETPNQATSTDNINSTTPTVVVESNLDKDKNEPVVEAPLTEISIYTKIIDVISNSNNKSVEIILSKDIAHDFDPTAYVKISPNIDFSVSKVNNRIILKGDFNLEQEYDITILKGIKSIDNSKLDEDKTDKLIFNQLEPKLMFSNEGIILPSTSNKNILFRSLNVNKVKVTVRKIYKNNTTQFLQSFNFKGNGNVEDLYSLDYIGDEVFSKDFHINNEKNNWVQSSIDMNGILDSNGAYLVYISFDENGTSYVFKDDVESWNRRKLFRNNGNIAKAVIISDLSMIAQVDNSTIAVKVMDILKNEPKNNVKVKFISRNNQLIAEKTTDAAGDILFDYDSKGFYLICEEGENTSILKLTNQLMTDGFDVGGVYTTDGLRSFMYTERGVYRPGDKVYLSIIARSNNEPLPNDHPIKINIYTPRGAKYIENDIIKEGKEGFYTYTFETNTSDETGIWTLEATIGSQKITKGISIETVMPYKIKAEITSNKKINVNSEPLMWSIKSEYLFGAPASGLTYEADIRVNENTPSFAKYRNFQFRSNTDYDYSYNDFTDGNLDEDGKASINTPLDKLEFKSINLIMTIDGRVKEDSGRPVLTREYINLNKFDSYVGIEIPDYYIKTGAPLGLKIITPDIEGEKLISGKKLVYRIYENSYSWWWDYYSYNEFIRSMKSDSHTTLLVEKEFTSTTEPYIINDIIDQYGYIFVEVEDRETGQIASVNMYSTEWADPASIKKVETLDIKTDKKTYNVGDKAQFTFKGVNGAKALIAIEQNGKVVRRYLKDVTNGEITETIDITSEMTPTIYAHVMLLQDYNQKENDRPLRLYGTAPIKIEDENTKININIDAPESIRPNERFKVKISNDKNKKVNYTIAVVDEGLLDITMFRTPDPWIYFYQKIASTLSMYDNYSEIMDKPFGKIHQILKTGGDYDAAAMAEKKKRQRDLGFEDADRFVPVSLFQGVLTTDDNGNAEVEFDMPNYMGSVRIMVIAAADNAYASAEKDMYVKAPIVVQQDLPRTLKVGDRFSFPVNVFALEDNVGEIEVTYNFRGKSQTQKVTLNKNEKKTLYFTDAVDPIVGTDKITITAKSGAYNHEETVGMAINSNSVPVFITKEAILKFGNDFFVEQNEEYIKGTVDSFATVSSRPLLGLDQRLKYLIRYPYGCLEQTTSSTMPQMFLDKLMTKQDYNKNLALQNVNAGIARLSKFQMSNGSFSYWPGQRETYDWATNYAGHFIVLARKNGYYVPDSMYNNWLAYTDRLVRGGFKDDNKNPLKVYAIYLLALSGNPNLSEMNYIQANYMSHLSEQSKMFLAAAYKLSGQEKIAKDIAKSVNKNKMFDDTSYYSYSYGSQIREMSIYLDCYYTVFEKIDEPVYKIIVDSLKSNNWYSTQSLNYSMIALANIIQKNEDRAIKITVNIDGNVKEYEGKSTHQVTIPEGAKNIKITSNDKSNVYVNYYLEGSPVNSTVEEYSDILNINRVFYNNNGAVINPTVMNTGDSFWMEVIIGSDVKNVSVENVAVNQILPSGWEIENLRINSTPYPKWVQEKINKQGYHSTYEDIRDDRIMWFFNFYAGNNFRTHSFFVKINVTTKGTFDFPGTKVEAMYDDNYKAYLKGFKVEVK